MPNALLLSSLVQFLGHNFLVIFLDNHGSDLDMAAALALSSPPAGNINVQVRGSLDCNLETEVLVIVQDNILTDQMFKNKNCFKEGLAWIAPSGIEPPGELRLDSDYFTLEMETSDSQIEIKEYYRLQGQLKQNSIGTWSTEGGLKVAVPEKWERRRNMNGLKLKVSTLPWPNVVNIDPRTWTFDGLIPNIVGSMADKYNFTLEWVLPEEKTFGVLGADGRWTGLVGTVQSGTVDMTAAGLAVTRERSEAVDFLQPFSETRATLIILDPALVGSSENERVNLTAYLSVFEPTGWLLFAFMMLTVLISCMVIFSYIENDLPFTQHLIKSTSFTYHALLRLGVPSYDSTGYISKKLLLLTAYAAVMVGMVYYEGMLTSFMTARAPTAKINSFFDALDQGYQVITLDGSQIVSELASAAPGTGKHKVYHETMKENPGVFCGSLNECKDKMLDDPSVIMYGSEFSFVGDRRFLPLLGLDDAKVDYAAFAVAKDSEFYGPLNQQMINLYETGMLDFLNTKWVFAREPQDVCGNGAESQGEAEPLGYDNLIFPCLVLSFGFMLAVAMIILEKLAGFQGFKKPVVKVDDVPVDVYKDY